jgi:hypothetical protein
METVKDGVGARLSGNCFIGSSGRLSRHFHPLVTALPTNRYQRELHDAQRPPLRLITTQDAPASSHLVLCVSGITWSEVGRTDDGKKIEPHPELEVTDGWYRLRAQIDEPLARAVRRGIIRVGRKIGVVGARVRSRAPPNRQRTPNVDSVCAS